VNIFARDGWLYRRVALPIVDLLRMGASPERLAWSIATGLLIGINPLLGSTTILCLAVALLFRLNIAASQLGNHIVYPLQLALIIPFLRIGSTAFRTAPIPLSPRALLDGARSHPLDLIRQLWLWEWHALIVWAVLAIILIPPIALGLKPLLTRMLARMEGRQHPSS
jgi:hypothetical protein